MATSGREAAAGLGGCAGAECRALSGAVGRFACMSSLYIIAHEVHTLSLQLMDVAKPGGMVGAASVVRGAPEQHTSTCRLGKSGTNRKSDNGRWMKMDSMHL